MWRWRTVEPGGFSPKAARLFVFYKSEWEWRALFSPHNRGRACSRTIAKRRQSRERGSAQEQTHRWIPEISLRGVAQQTSIFLNEIYQQVVSPQKRREHHISPKMHFYAFCCVDACSWLRDRRRSVILSPASNSCLPGISVTECLKISSPLIRCRLELIFHFIFY